jgi:hypothetical protein
VATYRASDLVRDPARYVARASEPLSQPPRRRHRLLPGLRQGQEAQRFYGCANLQCPRPLLNAEPVAGTPAPRKPAPPQGESMRLRVTLVRRRPMTDRNS